MFRCREEGEPVKYGFNFWRLSDHHSFGFALRFWHDRGLWFRYSKVRKKWFIYFVKEERNYNEQR